MVLMICETHLPDHLSLSFLAVFLFPKIVRSGTSYKQLNIRSMENWTLHKLLDGIDIREEGALSSGEKFSGFIKSKAR